MSKETEKDTKPENKADAVSKATADVARVLRASRRKRFIKWFFFLVLIGGGVAAYFLMQQPTPPKEWVSQPVDRGNIETTVTTTGSLEARRTVVVGAEVSGELASVEVDENEVVTEGQILACFDTEKLEASLAQAEASLTSARASVTRARASRDEAKSTEARVRKRVKAKTAAESELESAHAAYLRAAADLTSAKAQVAQAEAAYANAETNLGEAIITSPINGVVLLRYVEPGNTVAASLQSPELFLLAEDLSQMTLELEVDEADISLIKAGQKASFTVDAWIDETFEATVEKTRLYPTTENNVVTYLTTLSVANPEGLLRPGMTATATIVTDRRENVLRVPNTALSFTPPVEEEGESISLMPGPPHRDSKQSSGPGNKVYVLKDGEPTPINLVLGRSDGRFTEVTHGELKEGDQVVTGVKDPASEQGGQGAPQGGQGQGGQGGQGGGPQGGAGGGQ